MRIASLLRMAAFASLLPLAVGCAQWQAAPPDTVDVGFPQFNALIRTGERLSELRVTVHCASVRGLRDVPDGWSMKIEPLGRDYIVTVRPARALAQHDGPMPVLQLGLRGASSDCYGVKLVAMLTDGDVARTRSFRNWTRFGPLVY